MQMPSPNEHDMHIHCHYRVNHDNHTVSVLVKACKQSHTAKMPTLLWLLALRIFRISLKGVFVGLCPATEVMLARKDPANKSSIIAAFADL